MYFASLTKTAGSVGNIKQTVFTKTFSHIGNNSRVTLTEENCKRLGEFFAMLNPYIIQPSITLYGETPTIMPRELFHHTINNITPLISSICGLATGRSERDLDKIMNGKSFQIGSLSTSPSVLILSFDALPDIPATFNSCSAINLRCNKLPKRPGIYFLPFASSPAESIPIGSNVKQC